jgi:hypothetical protein
MSRFRVQATGGGRRKSRSLHFASLWSGRQVFSLNQTDHNRGPQAMGVRAHGYAGKRSRSLGCARDDGSMGRQENVDKAQSQLKSLTSV